MKRYVRPVALTAAAVICSLTAACSQGPSTGSGPTTVEVWRHSGTPAELRTLDSQVREFNAVHSGRNGVEVRLRTIPEGDYNDELQAASAANTLPDVVAIDGPNLASFVYQRRLRDLTPLLSAAERNRQLPSARTQGTVDGTWYAAASFDSGLGIYADRRQLSAAGVTWPTGSKDAWSAAEFQEALVRLSKVDPDGKVLDVKRNYGVGEWLTYGFSPLVASAGGELIDPVDLSASGHLDGAASRRALGVIRRWAPYIDPNTADKAFVTRKAALSWVGHWAYPDYAKALGKDLLLLPLPDLGNGTKTGQGSWAWAVTAASPSSTEAATFLRYLLRDEQVLRMTRANGAVPGTTTALAKSGLYGRNGPLRLFAEQLLHSCGGQVPQANCVATPRPDTPGYPLLSGRFASAVSVALDGEDPVPGLRAAAAAVDADLRANQGFR